MLDDIIVANEQLRKANAILETLRKHYLTGTLNPTTAEPVEYKYAAEHERARQLILTANDYVSETMRELCSLEEHLRACEEYNEAE